MFEMWKDGNANMSHEGSSIITKMRYYDSKEALDINFSAYKSYCCVGVWMTSCTYSLRMSKVIFFFPHNIFQHLYIHIYINI